MTKSFEQFAGFCSIFAGAAAFLYALAFIVLSRDNPETGLFLSSLALLLVGFFSTTAFVAVYYRVRGLGDGFALWGLFMAMAGGLAMMAHAGYDLANVINPPVSNIPSLANLPNQVDPRGLFVFGLGGVALLVNSWLALRSGLLPRGLAYVGFLSGALSLVLYVGRLIILTPTDPMIVFPALLNGFILGPLWFWWLGVVLVGKQEVVR